MFPKYRLCSRANTHNIGIVDHSIHNIDIGIDMHNIGIGSDMHNIGIVDHYMHNIGIGIYA